MVRLLLIVALLSLSAIAFPVEAAHLNPAYTGQIDLSGSPGGMSIDTTAQRLYTADFVTNTFWAVDTTTNAPACSASLPPGSMPIDVAANPATGLVYVVHLIGGVSVVDGATCDVLRTIPIIDPVSQAEFNTGGAIALNSATSRIYVTVFSDPSRVAVIDAGSEEILDFIPVGSSHGFTNDLKVNPTTNRIYVTNAGSDTISVIDGDTHDVSDIPVPRPASIAVDATANRIYVTSPAFFVGGSDLDPVFQGLSVIDGTTNQIIHSIPLTFPLGVAVNPATDRIYVAVAGGEPGLYILDRQTRAVVATLPRSCGNYGDVEVDPVSDTAYVASNCARLLVIGNGVLANLPPVAQCQNRIVPTDPGVCTANASVNNGSFDPDGDPITLMPSPAGPYALGITNVTLTVTDDQGASDACTAMVTVQDKIDPVIASVSANPSTLWPPNHKMVPVTVPISASDVCDAAPRCRIKGVSSNESTNGLGDGDTAPDWQITGDRTVNLRAERAGTGSGRVYAIAVECTDASANSSTGTVNVTVPHNR